MFLFGANISKNTYFCTRLSGLHEYKTTNMLLFLDIGGGELLLIIIAGMLLFGRDKMPGIIRSVAKGTDYIKKASEEVKQQINAETGLDEVLDDVLPRRTRRRRRSKGRPSGHRFANRANRIVGRPPGNRHRRIPVPRTRTGQTHLEPCGKPLTTGTYPFSSF